MGGNKQKEQGKKGFVQFLKEKNVGNRMNFSFRSLVVAFIFATVVAIIALTVINSQVKSFYNRSFQNNIYQVTITGMLESVDKELLSAVAISGAEEKENFLQSAEAEINEISDMLVDLKKGITNMDNLNRLNESMANLETVRGELIAAIEQGNDKEALRIYEGEYSAASEAVIKVLDDMSAFSKLKAEEQYNKIRFMGFLSSLVMVVVAIICVVYAGMLGVIITKMLTEPIEEIEAAVMKLKNGDLDVSITYEATDELGILAANFKDTCATLKEIIGDVGELLGKMAGGDFDVETRIAEKYVGEFVQLKESINGLNIQLSETLGQINEASEQVAMGSIQLAEGAQVLAEGATDQAGAVEELTATVENVSEIAIESAQDTENTYEMIVLAGKNAEKSKSELKELTNAMARISDTSKEIQNIIGAIEDIASQTNLLSLNASIEAARAGEAGKGFAVVADQIGKLAADSAQSAVNTKQLIEKSLEEIENGNAITEKTVGALEEILTSMNVFAESAQKISESSKSQADMLKQIEAGIEQVSEVVQTNSASAEETSATSEELSAQSESLRGLVAQFELKSR